MYRMYLSTNKLYRNEISVAVKYKQETASSLSAYQMSQPAAGCAPAAQCWSLQAGVTQA